MLPAGMALHSASKAPRQLGYLCSHSWSRACGGHSAVFTAAVEPQVILDAQLACLQLENSYLLGNSWLSCMCGRLNMHKCARMMCQACFPWYLPDVCRLEMSHLSSQLTQPSYSVRPQIKHAGSKTSNLQQVSVMQQSVMRISQ